MMKRFLVLAASIIALVACGKPNDVKTLHHEAMVVAQSYQLQLLDLDHRLNAIFKRGTTIPGNLPGIEVITPRLTEARDGLAQLRQIVGMPGDKDKSAVEKQADEAAKNRKVADLEKLIHDTDRTLGEGTTIIREDLNTVENWIAQYDQGTNRVGGPQPSAPQPEGDQAVPAPQGNPPSPPGNPAAPAGTPPAPPSGAQPTPAPAHP
ncbi:MAG TPA: hypothetical protein VL326_06000 [Kofleriaceae bacterium]|nr:hypothetical protein [Kofleriaceae bacterium]